MNLKNRFEKKVQIRNKLGLHARAAAKFVKQTSEFESKIFVKKGNKIVNGSSILGLMTLAAKKGSIITLISEGRFAKNELKILEDLILNNFDEEPVIKEPKRRERIFKGIGVSQGVAIGKCFYKENDGFNYSKYFINKIDIKKELMRFDKAVNSSILDLRKLIEKSKKGKLSANNEMTFILDAHISMLSSSSLVKDARKQIEKKLINAESAIEEELKKHQKIFNKIKNKYFKERFDDVEDVCRRLLNSLQKKKIDEKAPNLSEDLIMISKNFSPADLVPLQKKWIVGLISAFGGPEGHFSILARSLSIPTVVGAKDFFKNFKNKEKIILDGDKGLIIQNPTASRLRAYRDRMSELKDQSKKLNMFKKIDSKTKDGKKIFIEANVDNFDETKLAIAKGINGIGLFRSEYLFMNKKDLPSEDEQFQMFKNTLISLKGKVLTIRTLDIGNDKHSEKIDKLVGPSPNPALGLRAIRLTLAFPQIFKKQISAILRASVYGSIRIMLPMVSHVYELEAATKIIKEVHKELLEKKVKLKRKLPPIGVLIETPAAALISDILANHCDFFAIGTNDLVMYTLAIDRGDENVANIYEPSHLSVLKLIKMSKESADKNNIPISVCGEMAGDINFAPLILGLGIDTLSMSTSRILKIKQFINSMNHSDAISLSKLIFKEGNYKKIKKLLYNFSKSVIIS